MTGVLNAMVGGASVERLSFTLADLGGTEDYGAPSFAVSLRGGNTVFFIRYSADTDVLTISIGNAAPSQSFFQRIMVEDATPGVFQMFTSTSASYSLLGGTQGQWQWSSVTSLWTAADIDEVKRVEIHF